MNKKAGAVLAGLLLLLGFLLQSEVAAGEAPQTIKIGSAVSLTGILGGGGAQNKAGYEIGVEHINKKGGVFVKEFNKRIPMELIVLDDESNPTVTVNRMETLYNTHNVVAYLGGTTSFIHAAQAPIAEKNKVPFLMEGTMLWAVHQKGYKYNFSPFPKSPDVAEAIFALLNTVPQGQRPKRVAMFMEKGPVGMELADFFKKEMKKYGGYELVAQLDHTTGTKDFSPLILQAKSGRAEVLLTGPTPPDGILMVKQMKELGYFPKFFFMYRAADSRSWIESMKSDGDFLTVTPGWCNFVKFPGVEELNKRSMERFNHPADIHAGPAYACIQVLANAIERAGTLDRAKIRDAIAATDMMTVIGPTKFRADGNGDILPYVLQWQGEKHQIVWPKSIATAKLLYPAPDWSVRKK